MSRYYHELQIQILDESVRAFYQKREKECNEKELLPISYESSGFDLYFPNDVQFNVNSVTKVNMKIKCRMMSLTNDSEFSEPFFLYPRSSISKTPLMLANSIGLIDADYRGNIIAAFRCFNDPEFIEAEWRNDPFFKVSAGERLVQVVAPDAKPIKCKIVDNIDINETARGEGGFGSTGK
jgi:dUTP pyrophosphatase